MDMNEMKKISDIYSKYKITESAVRILEDIRKTNNISIQITGGFLTSYEYNSMERKELELILDTLINYHKRKMKEMEEMQ